MRTVIVSPEGASVIMKVPAPLKRSENPVSGGNDGLVKKKLLIRLHAARASQPFPTA
jgi:hypothetical protein